MTRKTLLVAALCATAVLAAAGIAYAVIPDASGQYTACMLKGVGTIRLIDKSASPSSVLSHCTSLETEISWNKQGVPGTNGVSPTVAQLASGDANCANGGAAITDAAGNTAYVCSGTNGTNGTDGADFAGTFTSPNGQYKLLVTDTGITLQGPVGRIQLTPTLTEIRADTDLNLLAGATAKLQGGALTQVRGPLVQLNTCGAPVARVGDSVIANPTGQIITGSPTVCSG
jgi:hypothetical protein